MGINSAEKERLEQCLDTIMDFYKKLDYKFNIEIIVKHEENVLRGRMISSALLRHSECNQRGKWE